MYLGRHPGDWISNPPSNLIAVADNGYMGALGILQNAEVAHLGNILGRHGNRGAHAGGFFNNRVHINYCRFPSALLLQYSPHIIQMQTGVLICPDDKSFQFPMSVKGVPALAIQIFIFHPINKGNRIATDRLEFFE